MAGRPTPQSSRLSPHAVGDAASGLAGDRQTRRLQPLIVAAVTMLAAVPLSFAYGYALTLAGPPGVSGPVVLAVLAAAAISSIAGFAFSALCGAILLHLVNSPTEVVQIMLVCSIGIQSCCTWILRRDIEWRALPPLLLGGLMGLPMGLWLLLHLSRAHYGSALGALLVLYGAWMLLRRAPTTWRAPRYAGVLAGLLGGMTGGMAALPGPPVTVLCNLQGWSKVRQRGVTQPFILLMQLSTLAVLYALGSGTASAAAADLSVWAYLPSALVGTWIGLSVFRCLSDRQFAVAVNVLLIVSGLGLGL